MSKMFPPSIKGFQNEHYSEIEIYSFLKYMLPDNYYVYWNIRVGNFYPDFIIVEPNLGLIVLEVKDWSLGAISDANDCFFYFKPDDKSSKNPLRQARDYSDAIINVLSKENSLLNTEGNYKGKIRFCYTHGVIFTSIAKNEFLDSNLNQVIDENFILFKDEIEFIGNNKDTNILEQKLYKMFVPERSFQFDPLSHEDMRLIGKVLYKELNLSSSNEKYSIQSDDNYPLCNNKYIDTSNNVSSTKSIPVRKNKSTKNKKYILIKNLIIIFLISSFFIQKVIYPNISKEDMLNVVNNFIERLNKTTSKSFSQNNEFETIELEPVMVFNVKNNPQGKGTFILIKDGGKYIINNTFVKDSSIEFYDNKKIIIYDTKSDKKEFYADADVIDLEVGNAYTKIYLKGKEHSFIKYFKYDFVNGEIIKTMK